jgi:hypothetical protein
MHAWGDRRPEAISGLLVETRATTQALVDAELLKLSPTIAFRTAERAVRVARAFLSELSERARNFVL